jgi:glycine C-acetyltransferase
VTHALHAGLRENGFDLGRAATAVTPVYFNGHVWAAMEFVRDLREHWDVFCAAVTFPVVPPGTVMLRLIPTCLHTLDDVTHTVRAFCEARPTFVGEGAVAGAS